MENMGGMWSQLLWGSVLQNRYRAYELYRQDKGRHSLF